MSHLINIVRRRKRPQMIKMFSEKWHIGGQLDADGMIILNHPFSECSLELQNENKDASLSLEPHPKSIQTAFAAGYIPQPKAKNMRVNIDISLEHQDNILTDDFLLMYQSGKEQAIVDPQVKDMRDKFVQDEGSDDNDNPLYVLNRNVGCDEETDGILLKDAMLGNITLKEDESEHAYSEEEEKNEHASVISRDNSFKEMFLPEDCKSIDLDHGEQSYYVAEKEYTPKKKSSKVNEDLPKQISLILNEVLPEQKSLILNEGIPKEQSPKVKEDMPKEKFPGASDVFLNLPIEMCVEPEDKISFVRKWVEDLPDYESDHDLDENMPSTSGATQCAVRHSQRIKHRPLEFWRNERIIYKYTESGDIVNLGVDPGTTNHAAWHMPKNTAASKKKLEKRKNRTVGKPNPQTKKASSFAIPPEVEKGLCQDFSSRLKF